MIKDKITPELKKRFLDELRISKETGDERGFVLCLDEKENITASETCTGDRCAIDLGDIREKCPTGIAQGDFHTHPYLKQAKEQLRTGNREIPSDEKIMNHMKNNMRKMHEDNGVQGITINSPSGDDLLHTLISKHSNRSRGTICTLSDIGDNKLECWTAKEIHKDKMDIFYAKVYSDTRKRSREDETLLIESWIDRIFDREIIDLDR
jgi:hypothetical protein